MAADSPPLLCIRLMSGPSLDPVDGCLLAMTDSARMQGTDAATPMRQLAFASRSMPPALRAELLALNTPGGNELHRAALAANALMALYAEVTQALCKQAAVQPVQIAVIGAHGQTVRHRPQMFDGTGYTLQLVNGALLAERTGIAVAEGHPCDGVGAGVGRDGLELAQDAAQAVGRVLPVDQQPVEAGTGADLGGVSVGQAHP